MKIDRLDHLVLTVASIEITVKFYELLGFEHIVVNGRHALRFGRSKVNLHQDGHSFQPAARLPTPGSGDLCFVVGDSVEAIQAALETVGIPIEEGPVDRSGALGSMKSCYIRDPDGNLLEFCSY